MYRSALAVAVLACLLLASLALPAHADDAVLTPEMIRAEIEAYQAKPPSNYRVYWKQGLHLESRDKRFKMGFHGRIMSDWYFFGDVDQNLASAVGADFHSGFVFRRAWLTVNGYVFKHISYMAQYAFEPGVQTAFLDVWVGLRAMEDCLGCWAPDLRIGHYQEPFGLAWLTSSKFFQLMAWPTPTTTFTPGYNSGIEVSNQWYGDRVTARVGVFGNDSSLDGDTVWTDGQAVTGRFTFLPWAPCDCDGRVFEVGVSASYRWDVRQARFRSRANIDLGPAIVDTGTFGANDVLLVDFEAAFVYDRFNIQAEYTIAQVDATTGTDPSFWGAYLQAGYMLFGAPYRNFNKKTASFGQTKVCNGFLQKDCCGPGAWELAARVSYVDTDDGDKQGGEVYDFAVGINWYLVENARVMLNYIHADVTNAHGSRNFADADGTFDAIAVRFQVHW